MEKKNKRRPWGIQDALQAQRGLLRSISPQHLVVEPSISYNLRKPRQRSCAQQQHCTDDRNACLSHQKVLYHEGVSHQRQRNLVHTHVVQEYQQQTHSQQKQHQELHQPADDPRDRPVRPQRSLHDSISRRNHEANTSAIPFRPQTADKQCSAASVAARPAGAKSTAEQSTLSTDVKGLERIELRRCSSCSSIRQVQHRSSQQWTTQQESSQQHVQQRNPQSHHAEQQLRTHEQEYPQDHLRQQQQSCQQPFAHTDVQYSREKQQAKYSGRDTALRKIVSDETGNKSPVDVALFPWTSVCHGPPKSHVREEIGYQRRTDSVCVDGFCSAVAVEESSAVPLQTDDRPPAAAKCTSPCDSHSDSGADLSKSGTAPQCVSSAAMHPATTATKYAAGASRAAVTPLIAGAPSIIKKAALIRSHSLQESSRRGPLREKFPRQNLSLVNASSSPTLQQPVGDASRGEAVGLPVQAPIGSTAATQVVADGTLPSQCLLLQESRTYAAFSKIAVELIRQQQQLHRSDEAAHVYHTALSDFPAAATVEAEHLLCAGASAIKATGVSRMAAASRTARSSSTAHTSHAAAATSSVPAAAPAASRSAGNRLQPATPWRRNVKSAAPGFIRNQERFVPRPQHLQQETSDAVPREQYQLRQRPHTQQQSLQEVQSQELSSQRDLMLREINKGTVTSPSDAPSQKEGQQVPSRHTAPVSASLQPHTTCCSTVTGTSSSHSFRPFCQKTGFPCHRSDEIHPEGAPVEHTADITCISPVGSHTAAAVGLHVTPAAAFASVPVETGASVAQVAAHGSAPTAARSTSAVSATAAVERDYPTVACRAPADGTCTHSRGHKSTPGVACIPAGTTAAVVAAVPASVPTMFCSNFCAAYAAAAGGPVVSDEIAAGVVDTDTASTAMPSATLKSDSVSARKSRFAVSSFHLTSGPQERERNSSGVALKTLLDVSSYSLGSAPHDTVAEAVAPGPLLLLFAFYSRIFPHLEKENTCTGLTANRIECTPQGRSGRLSTVSSNSEDKANGVTTSKSSGDNCSDENCSKGEQVIMSQSSSNTNNSNSSRGSGTGIRRPSSGSCCSGVNGTISRIHNCNSSGSCEDSGSRHFYGEDSSSTTCSRCARLQMENSTRRKLPPRIALSRLLEEPVSLTDLSFGLLEAQAMVKHFALYLPQFFVPPFLVEELWVLILLTTGVRRAAAADNPTPANVSVAPSSSDTAEAEFTPFFPSLTKTCPADAVPAVIPFMNDAPRAATRPGAPVSRNCRVGSNCSIQTANNRLMATSAFSPAAATAVMKPRAAASGIHEAAPPHQNSSGSPLVFVGDFAAGLSLNVSSKQLHQQRLNFLGFSAFLAAVFTLATKCAPATDLTCQQKATFCAASSPPTSGGPATSLEQLTFTPAPDAAGVDTDAAATATDLPRAAFAAVKPSCSTAADTECSAKDKRSLLVDFQCVQQFMQRFSTAKAVKRFLLEVYVELRACTDAAPEQRQVNDKQKVKTSQSVIGGPHRVDSARTEAVPSVASAATRPAREIASSRRTVTALEPTPSERSNHTSVAAEHERKIYAEKGEKNLDAPRRRTEEIFRRSPSMEDLAGLRRRWNSVAAMQLKDGVYKDILNSINIPRGSIVLNTQACPSSQKQTVAPERTDAVATSTTCSPAAPSLPSSPALSDPCHQQQKAKFLKQIEHPLRRHLWSTLPRRATLQWLLLRYTFSPVTPLWLPFGGLFIDMGVQRSISRQECQQEELHSAADMILPQEGTTLKSAGFVPDSQCIHRDGVFTDSEQQNTADKNMQAPAETCPKEKACCSSASERTDPAVRSDIHQCETKKEQQQQQTVPQQTCYAQDVSSKTASGLDNDAPASECGDAAAKVATAGGALTVKMATAGGHGDFVIASALHVRTYPAESTVPGQTSSPYATASVGATGHSVPATCRDFCCTALKSVETAAPVAGVVLNAVAGFKDCFVAAESLQGESNSDDTVNTSVSGSTRIDPTVANHAAPQQSNNDVEQQKSCAAIEKTTSEELAAVAAPASEDGRLSLEPEGCRLSLPPNRWWLLRDRIMQQRHRIQQRRAMLQERAIQKARTHRFAIEVENKTTTPVAVVVDLENLPPVKAREVSKCKTPLLLVPGSSKRIMLDIDRTHEPGEWLGFAHLRVRSRRGSSSTTRVGERGSSFIRACSGGTKVNWSHNRGKSDSSAWCISSIGSDNAASNRRSSPSSEAQRTGRTSQTEKKNGISNRSRGRSGDNSSMNDKGNDERGCSFFENVASVPIYLRLVADHEHEDVEYAPVSHPQAPAEAELPVSTSRATAAPAETPATSTATISAGFVQTGATQKQKRIRYRHARLLSPLPLHVCRASIASVLDSISRKTCNLQPASLCGLCSPPLLQGVSQCQQEEQQIPCQQRQRPALQPKQPQERMLRRAASDGATVPSTVKEALHYTSGLTSAMPQHQLTQVVLADASATECSYRTTSCGIVGNRTCIRKSSSGGSTSSKNTPYVCQSMQILLRSTERSSKSTLDQNSKDDRESSRISNHSSHERTGVLPLSDVEDSSQSVTQEVSLSPSLSVASSSSSNSLDEEEIDWHPSAAAPSASGFLELLSTGQRLNAREYSFFHRAQILERLQQMVPDCYQLGQRLLHQQQRLQRQRRSQYYPFTSPVQHKQNIELPESDVGRQRPQCHRLHRQLPAGKWPQHQHIRWLRGNLLYGKDPVERKGWTLREAGTTADQHQQRQKASPVVTKYVRAASANETKKTCPPPVDPADVEHSFDGKLPWSAPLFYYDSTDSSVFRCSGCGLSFWGKFTCQTKDDPITALRNMIEEELREASTASCSTSVPLP